MIKRILIIIVIIILIIVVTNYSIKLIYVNEGFLPILQKRRRAQRATMTTTATTKSLSKLVKPIINEKIKSFSLMK